MTDRFAALGGLCAALSQIPCRRVVVGRKPFGFADALHSLIRHDPAAAKVCLCAAVDVNVVIDCRLPESDNTIVTAGRISASYRLCDYLSSWLSQQDIVIVAIYTPLVVDNS